MKKIGILGMQGAIEEHREKLKKLAGIEPVIVKTKEKIAEVDGLILPGGESTAMGRLLNYFNLTEPLKQSIEAGLPVWGTCAGMILLAKNIEDQDERYLSTMDKRSASARFHPCSLHHKTRTKSTSRGYGRWQRRLCKTGQHAGFVFSSGTDRRCKLS